MFQPTWEWEQGTYFHVGYGSSVVPTPNYRNVQLTGLMRIKEASAKESGIGVVFGQDSLRNHYQVKLEENYVKFLVRKDGELIREEKKNHTLEFGTWYNLTVNKRGATVAVFLNDTEVLRVHDITFSNQSVAGFTQWGENVRGEYMHFTVKNESYEPEQLIFDFQKHKPPFYALDYALIAPKNFIKLLNNEYNGGTYNVIVQTEKYHPRWELTVGGKSYSPLPVVGLLNGYFVGETMNKDAVTFTFHLKKYVLGVWLCLLVPLLLFISIAIVSTFKEQKKQK